LIIVDAEDHLLAEAARVPRVIGIRRSKADPDQLLDILVAAEQLEPPRFGS
jgi:hypothetical protein